MRIACLQPRFFQDRDKCYSEIENNLKKLLNQFDANIVCLPERWVPLLNNIPLNFQKERGDDYNFIKDLAKEYNINILSGGIWEKRNNLKPSITCYYFNKKGEEIGRQDKIHLYSYERRHFKPGKELNLFKLNNFYFAILICFDMAFYETPRLAAESGADFLCSPTQIREDGMENWEIYLKARVLENRIPIAACNSVGEIEERRFVGKSKIISFVRGYITPSKLRVIEGATGSSACICDDIDLEFPKKLRKERLNEKVEKSKIKVTIVNN